MKRKLDGLTYEEYAKMRETCRPNGKKVDKSKYTKVNKRSKVKEGAAIAEILGIAGILKANKVDLSKIQLTKSIKGVQRYTLLEEIEQEGINMQKIIEENKLDGKFPFGMRVMALRTAYNGLGGYKITEEEKQEAKELGLVREEKGTAIAETLRIARILDENKVDLSKIQITKTINKNTRYILLEEIEQEGIDMQKTIEENKLDGKFKFGMRVYNLRRAYNETGGYKITEEEKQQARKLGLISKKLTDKKKEKREAIRTNKKVIELYQKYRGLSIARDGKGTH